MDSIHQRHVTHASPLCDWHTRRPIIWYRLCVGVLIGSVSTHTRQYCVPCAYMHAVVPPAFSHARLKLDWLASSRASSVTTIPDVSVSHDMRLVELFLATKNSSWNRRDHEWNSLDADVRPAINADEASIPESLFLFFASAFRHICCIRLSYCLARGE
jgi:hypothetical protein